MWWVFFGWVWAAPRDEEIVVYGDPFARWDHTRWLVDAELRLPAPLLFGTDDNLTLEAHAVRLSLVVSCEKAGRQLGDSYEVDCRIDDLGLQAATALHWHPRMQETAEHILTDLDARLTGAAIQLQADAKNGLVAVDVEGWQADNARERMLQENARQMLRLVMAGFHLRLPPQIPQQGKWEERHSMLASMPNTAGSQGSSRLVHTTSLYQGLVIAQTLGQGTTTAAVGEFRPTEPVYRELIAVLPIFKSGEAAAFQGSGSGPGGKMLSLPPPTLNKTDPVGRGEGELSGIELTYALEVSGVGVIDPATGILRERVWAVRGTPTASSGDSKATAAFLHQGQLRLLGPEEAPEMLPTRQASWPDQVMEGLPAWQAQGTP